VQLNRSRLVSPQGDRTVHWIGGNVFSIATGTSPTSYRCVLTAPSHGVVTRMESSSDGAGEQGVKEAS